MKQRKRGKAIGDVLSYLGESSFMNFVEREFLQPQEKI
jgi:hypothetical protein